MAEEIDPMDRIQTQIHQLDEGLGRSRAQMKRNYDGCRLGTLTVPGSFKRRYRPPWHGQMIVSSGLNSGAQHSTGGGETDPERCF
jgi:hypothetical protein